MTHGGGNAHKAMVSNFHSWIYSGIHTHIAYSRCKQLKGQEPPQDSLLANVRTAETIQVGHRFTLRILERPGSSGAYHRQELSALCQRLLAGSHRPASVQGLAVSAVSNGPVKTIEVTSQARKCEQG